MIVEQNFHISKVGFWQLKKKFMVIEFMDETEKIKHLITNKCGLGQDLNNSIPNHSFLCDQETGTNFN